LKAFYLFIYAYEYRSRIFDSHRKNALALGPSPQHRTGGDSKLKLRIRLCPRVGPRATPSHEVLSPSLRARMMAFGRRFFYGL